MKLKMHQDKSFNLTIEWKKLMTFALPLCYVITNCMLFMSLEYQEWRKSSAGKIFWKLINRNFQNLVQDMNLWIE